MNNGRQVLSPMNKSNWIDRLRSHIKQKKEAPRGPDGRQLIVPANMMPSDMAKVRKEIK